MLARLRHSVLIKVLGLLVLTVLLCIPLAQIEELTRERGNSQREAAAELASTYTGAQTLAGPFIVQPYVERWMEPQRDAQGRVVGQEARSKEMRHLVFPDRLHLEGSLAPQERYRGIFRIPFYALDGALEGAFAAFDAAALPHSEKESAIELKPPFVAPVSYTHLTLPTNREV